MYNVRNVTIKDIRDKFYSAKNEYFGENPMESLFILMFNLYFEASKESNIAIKKNMYQKANMIYAWFNDHHRTELGKLIKTQISRMDAFPLGTNVNGLKSKLEPGQSKEIIRILTQHIKIIRSKKARWHFFRNRLLMPAFVLLAGIYMFFIIMAFCAPLSILMPLQIFIIIFVLHSTCSGLCIGIGVGCSYFIEVCRSNLSFSLEDRERNENFKNFELLLNDETDFVAARKKVPKMLLKLYVDHNFTDLEIFFDGTQQMSNYGNSFDDGNKLKPKMGKAEKNHEGAITFNTEDSSRDMEMMEYKVRVN